MKSNLTRLLLITLFLTVLPSMALAQTDTKLLVFEIKNVPKIPDVQTIQNFSNNKSAPKVAPVDPIKINAPILADYLSQKGSPLAPFASNILQNDNWKLVLAISNGESTLCKHQLYNNCWGVGGAWNLRRYASFSQGFADVDQLLANKYLPTSTGSPKEIVRKYVGSYSPTWVYAVNQTLAELNQLPLIN